MEDTQKDDTLCCEWHQGMAGAEDGFALRMEVFTGEQDFPAEIEVDAVDQTAHHLILRRDGAAVAVARLFPGERPGEYLVGRVCVKRSCRGQHLGLRLLAAIECRARELGAQNLVLHAQVNAEGFYRAAGYVSQGQAYTEDGWPHVTMTKAL